MAQVRRIPFRGSETLGRGVNTLTGEVVGKALNVISTEEATPGQDATYDVEIVETHESLMESLGLSVEASGRYGLFSAEGKFKLAEKSSFNSQSTFVVASCRVQNAFKMVDRVEILPEAQQLREDPEKFKTAFGTGFVRGLQTGGEFYAVLQVTSTDTDVQKSLGVAFQAECQGLAAGGSFSAQYDQAKSSKTSESTLSIFMYQRAGQDDQLSLTQNATEVLERLRSFPTIARQYPCGYEAEVADYNTLALPIVNEEEVADREMALTDCARLRLKYMTRRNDLDFALQNPQFFVDLPDAPRLQVEYDTYSRAVIGVQLHAQKIASRSIPPTIVDTTVFNLPADPVVLKRKDIPTNIPAPNVMGLPLDVAKSKLEQFGLLGDSHSVAVAANSGQPLNTVVSQSPEPDTPMQKGQAVTLNYNYVPDERFNWIRAATIQNRVLVSNLIH